MQDKPGANRPTEPPELVSAPRSAQIAIYRLQLIGRGAQMRCNVTFLKEEKPFISVNTGYQMQGSVLSQRHAGPDDQDEAHQET